MKRATSTLLAPVGILGLGALILWATKRSGADQVRLQKLASTQQGAGTSLSNTMNEYLRDLARTQGQFTRPAGANGSLPRLVPLDTNLAHAILTKKKPLPPGMHHWTEDPIPLIKGRGYYVVLELHGLPSTLSSIDRVRKVARGEGFTHVILSDKGPPGGANNWPPHASGDYYLSGVYEGEDREVARRQKDGDVIIKDVYIL